MALRRSVSFPRGTKVTYVPGTFPSGNIELRRNARGTRCPRRHTCKSLLSVWNAQLWQGKRQARGGSQSQVVEPGKLGRRPPHQRHRCPAQVHLPEGLGGRHTLSRVSLDSQRRGEIRGLEVIGEHPDPLLSISTLASTRGNV